MILSIIKIISTIPLQIRILIGRICGYLYSRISRRETTITKLQMKISLKEHYKAELASKTFANVGQSVMECLNLKPYLSRIDNYIDCPNWEIAEELKKKGNSIIALTAHTGNWDLLAAYVIKRGFKLSTIARTARNKHLHKILVKIRDSYGINTIWKDSQTATREIIQALRSGAILAALIDQDLEDDGLYIPFFEIKAKYPAKLISLAKKNKSEIIAAFIFRTGMTKYRIFLHRLDQNKLTSEILKDYSNLLENYIKIYPDQWVWFHKRWRSLEDGSRLSGKKYIEYLKEYENKNNSNAD